MRSWAFVVCSGACLLVAACSERLLLDEAGLVIDTDGTQDTDRDDDNEPTEDDDATTDPTVGILDVAPCVPGSAGCPCPPGQVAVDGVCVVSAEVELVPITPIGVDALAGDVVADSPIVQVLSGGQPVAGVTVDFVTGGFPGSFTATAQAVTDAEGFASSGPWTLGKFDGDYTVTASAPNATSVVFTGSTISDFEITLNYINTATDSQQVAFDLARRRWQGGLINAHDIVAGDRSMFAAQCGTSWPSEPTTVAGVEIFVELTEIDGPGGPNGNILGQAGPCFLREDGSPAFGSMRFDVFDLDELEAEGSLETVILHEMGHVLGVGTLWPAVGLLRNPSVPNNPGADTHFPGFAAAPAFEELLMGNDFVGGIVPVENDGSPGSADGHWRESVFGNELMSPRLGGFGRVAPLSWLTLASLQDHAYYVVNRFAADPYALPLLLVEEPDPHEGDGWRRRDELIAPRWQLRGDEVVALP